MKINWKVRFKNKTWLTMFIGMIVGFAFNMMKLFDVAPAVTESFVMNVVGEVLTFLGLIGVLVDPTTAGIGDSDRALGYQEPWNDAVENIEDNEDVEDVEDDEEESETEEKD